MTVKIPIFLSAIIILLVLTTKAQTIRITGNVIDLESGKPISGANVELFRKDVLEKKTTSNDSGKYLFLIDTTLYKSKIKVSLIGYETISFSLALNKSDKTNDFFLGITKLKTTPILLNEVIIKKSKRYRDSSIIDLSTETFERSIMIDDIFSLKGFRKGADGILYYKDKVVSDIMVNNGNFFGKNNIKIYDKLPALILENIEVVETNIDSITNTTLLAPLIKINLKTKENYLKGKFGVASGGTGTKSRSTIGTDLYAYKKQEQISFATGLNNLGSNEGSGEPTIGFSAVGNNAEKKFGNLTYRNLFNNKIELEFLTRISSQDRLSISESDRIEENIQQRSSTKNSSSSKLFQIEDIGLNMRYRIDSLNSMELRSEFKYDNNRSLDSLSYYIESSVSKLNSLVYRNRSQKSKSMLNGFQYERKFHKKGRSFHIDYDSERLEYNINELAQTVEQTNKYSITGNRDASQNTSAIRINITEPIGEHQYLKISTSYKNETLDYFSTTMLDAPQTTSEDINKIKNIYLQSGLLFQTILNKLSIITEINAIASKRNIQASQNSNLFNFNVDIKVNKRINSQKNLSWTYMVKPNYPNIYQLTSLNNSFDLISQTKGNINLKPEVKHNIGFVYDLKKSDSLSLLVSAEANYYFSRFGLNIMSIPGETQNIFTDNIGKSKSALITFLTSKTFSKIGNINYIISLNYTELPSTINNIKNLTKGITVTQSLSTDRTIIKDFISISPIISVAYDKYSYSGTNQTSLNLTYSDKLALNFSGIEMNTFPIINISKAAVSKNYTWAINSEIRKKIFNKYGIIWFKAYDIFNSFQIQRNVFGPSYTQSFKYSNFSRYFLLGITYKFNNIN